MKSIVDKTCVAIWECLKAEYMPVPTQESLLRVARDFEETWNFPHVIGAIDGKHVVLQAPPNSGSVFFNYKGTFSIVLMALVSADYQFLAVDIGNFGSNSDGGVFRDSNFGQLLESGEFNVPEPSIIPGAEDLGPMNFAIVGDEAFPLKSYLLRPFPGRGLALEQKVFNYRLSRARRVSENAFGILAQRWRLFQRRIVLHPESAVKVVQACCMLHNFLLRDEPHMEMFNGDNGDDEPLHPLRRTGYHGTRQAMQLRLKYTQYFMNHGAVAWQQGIVESTG